MLGAIAVGAGSSINRPRPALGELGAGAPIRKPFVGFEGSFWSSFSAALGALFGSKMPPRTGDGFSDPATSGPFQTPDSPTVGGERARAHWESYADDRTGEVARSKDAGFESKSSRRGALEASGLGGR